MGGLEICVGGVLLGIPGSELAGGALVADGLRQKAQAAMADSTAAATGVAADLGAEVAMAPVEENPYTGIPRNIPCVLQVSLGCYESKTSLAISSTTQDKTAGYAPHLELGITRFIFRTN